MTAEELRDWLKPFRPHAKIEITPDGGAIGCYDEGDFVEIGRYQSASGPPRHELINPPKDIQEGTLNCLLLISNLLHEGNVREAGLQVDDLIDQVTCRALVITKRVEPLAEGERRCPWHSPNGLYSCHLLQGHDGNHQDGKVFWDDSSGVTTEALAKAAKDSQGYYQRGREAGRDEARREWRDKIAAALV